MGGQSLTQIIRAYYRFVIESPTILSMHQVQSPTTLSRDGAKIMYLSGAQPPPHKLGFGVELDPNPNSKIR